MKTKIESSIVIIIWMVASVMTLIMGVDAATEPTEEETIFSSVYSVQEEEPLELDLSDEIITYKNLGKFRLTVYTPSESSWGYQTATGKKSEHLITCAVDPKVIPYGTKLKIGDLHLIAVDCGNFSGKMIDIFYDGTIVGAMEWLEQNFGDYAEVEMMVVKEKPNGEY